MDQSSTRPIDKASERARRACLEALDAWDSGEPFSWPLDGVASRGFGYHVADAACAAWNAEGRVTPCGDFYRRWLTEPGNVEAAVEQARAAWRDGACWGPTSRTLAADLEEPSR